MPPSTPQRLAVIGVGQIGSAFAFNLVRRGEHDVTVIARPGSVRLEQLRRDGAIVSVAGERAPVRVVDALDEGTPYDLVIVTLLAHQVAVVRLCDSSTDERGVCRLCIPAPAADPLSTTYNRNCVERLFARSNKWRGPTPSATKRPLPSYPQSPRSLQRGLA